MDWFEDPEREQAVNLDNVTNICRVDTKCGDRDVFNIQFSRISKSSWSVFEYENKEARDEAYFALIGRGDQ